MILLLHMCYGRLTSYRFCIICALSKKRSSLSQALMKIKRKVKWMVKFVKP